MSSMRNAVARRNHKERSQPESRSKWGLLEKHKDYSLRAKDYNVKKQKLNILSQKSRERHPDEFAFGMLSSEKGVQGKHGRSDQTKNQLSHDAVKLLKTQDGGYLRTVAARGRKEIDRLTEQVGMDGALKKQVEGNDKKIVFDENGEPFKKRRRLSDESVDEMESDMGDLDVLPEDDVEEVIEIEQAVDISDDESKAPKIVSRKLLERRKEAAKKLKADKKRRRLLRDSRAAKLVELKKRQQQILAAADQLDLQRAKMARTIGGVNKNGVKFKIRERKR